MGPTKQARTSPAWTLWQGLSMLLVFCDLIQVDLVGEDPQLQKLLRRFVWLMAWLVKRIYDGFMIFELSHMKGKLRAHCTFLHALSNPQLETFCTESDNATLKISLTHVLLFNGCVATIERSYLDIHNCISFMCPMHFKFFPIFVDMYWFCTWGHTLQNGPEFFWVNGCATRAYLQRGMKFVSTGISKKIFIAIASTTNKEQLTTVTISKRTFFVTLLIHKWLCPMCPMGHKWPLLTQVLRRGTRPYLWGLWHQGIFYASPWYQTYGVTRALDPMVHHKEPPGIIFLWGLH